MIMKKVLLMMVALMTTVTIFAKDDEEMEGWQKIFTPVTDASELSGLHTAVAGDGSVYASSTYNQDFQFAEKTVVADPDGMTYSCVLKYDKDGKEQWAVTLAGKCKVYGMTADTDGTLYVAGKSEDLQVTMTGTDGAQTVIENPTGFNAFFEEVIKANECFIAKINAEGVIQYVKTIIPEVNPEIYAIVGDPYDMGMEMSIYDLSGNDPSSVTPCKIVLDGDKVYVAAIYTGDVEELGWKGAYLNYDGMDMMIFDIRSMGVFSLSKSDLSSPASVATVMPTETVQTMTQYFPEAIDFVVYGGVPHVAFFGFGDLTLTTAAGAKPFSFDMDEEGLEHALVLANVNAPEYAKKFGAAKNSNSYPTYELVGATLAGENCILAGTFYGNFPLDNTVTNEFNTSFVASIKMADCSVNWATPNTAESYATCMVVTGEEIKASTDIATYTLKTETGEVKAEQTMEQSFNDADVYNDEYVSTISADGANVVIFSPHMNPSGIEAVKAAAAKGETKIFNLNGQRVAEPQKGLYIVNGQKAVIK